MIVQVKKLPHAPPEQLFKKHSTDAGYDLRCAGDIIIKPVQELKTETDKVTFSDGTVHRRTVYEKQLLPTGIQIAPEDLSYFWLVPRSGFSSKYLMGIRNVPGLVDFEYRGEVFISAMAFGHPIPVARGERIAQLVPVIQTKVEIEFVHELSESKRGSGGFGSTGQ